MALVPTNRTSHQQFANTTIQDHLSADMIYVRTLWRELSCQPDGYIVNTTHHTRHAPKYVHTLTVFEVSHPHGFWTLALARSTPAGFLHRTIFLPPKNHWDDTGKMVEKMPRNMKNA